MTTNTKNSFFYPTAFSGWGDEEHAAMARVIESGRYTMGQETEALEEELAAFNRRKHAVAVNSGSSANLIAVSALLHTMIEHKPVLASVPALAWGTTYAPLIQHRFNLRLRDCNDAWNQSHIIGSDEADIGLHVACSVLGNPADPLILDPANLNDDCESFGATVNGEPTGKMGQIATQSFFWSHQLGAIEGGAVLTDDDDLTKASRMLRDHGLDRTTVGKAVPFDKEYSFQCFGYNVRPLEMHMAIAREQLKKAAIHRTARRKNWNTFMGMIRSSGVIDHLRVPPLAEGANPFGIHFEVLGGKRQQLVQALRAGGVDCRMPTGGSFRLHPYGAPWKDQQTPRADEIHRTGLFIGNAPYDIEDQISHAVAIMKEGFEL